MFTMDPPWPPRLVDILRTASREQRITPATFTASTREIRVRFHRLHTGEASCHPRVVHQASDRPELPLRRLEQPNDISLQTHIALNPNRPSARGHDVCGNPVRRRFVRCIIDSHRKPVSANQPRDRRSNAPAPSGDDHRSTICHTGHSMDSYLRFARRNQKALVALLREFVECESPSDSPMDVNRFVDLLRERVRDIAKVKTFDGGSFGKHLCVEFTLPGTKKEGQLLALGHSDTVWTLGTLRTMPFLEKKGRLWGPGVLDMKAGLAFFIFAVRALRVVDEPVGRTVVMQVNSDEEVGSETSRPLTEDAARSSTAVLVLEPGTGLEGKLKTARKGVGNYTIVVRGRASHAGVDFASGANAIVEMSRQLERVAGFTRLDRGVTVSPGVIQGGTRSNVVPAECRAEVDISIPRLRDRVYMEKKIATLKPIDTRCAIELTGGLNRPPMERSAGVRKLYRTAEKLAAELGVTLQESSTGGGSDGNFTAALGIPTLDGLGAVGEGAHAPNESILVNRIADRTALLAKLVAAL